MLRIVLVQLGVALLLAVGALQAQVDEGCDLPSRMIPGEAGRVTDVVLNLRTVPELGDNVIGQVQPYTMFTVLNGNVCSDGYVWWQVETRHADSVTGWLAEGTLTDEGEPFYWMDSRGERVTVVDDGEIERDTVTLPDGTTEPEGCLLPPDDYEQQQFGFATLNQRTVFMLDQAQRIYEAGGGTRMDFRLGLTQGSYNAGGVNASFGTHDGGGAVDLSVRDFNDQSVLVDDIEPAIYALRVAGFAAWLRDTNSLYPGSPIHIHAIAIGDAELSPAALLQVEGEDGYFAGFDALPPDYGGPNPDAHGGPIVCGWMRELGYGE